jgi:hypothetical protein
MKKPVARKQVETTSRTMPRELTREELARASGGDNPGMGPYDPPQVNGCVKFDTSLGWPKCIEWVT